MRKHRNFIKMNFLICLGTAFLLFGKSVAYAKDLDITITDPISDGKVTITITSGTVTKIVTVDDIKATDNKTQKATKIRNKLVAAGFNKVSNTATGLKIRGLAEGATGKFDDDGTGQSDMKLASVGMRGSSLAYDSLFETGSVIEGGFFTDLGEINLEMTLTADTQGTDITQQYFDYFLAQDFHAIGISSLFLTGGTIFAQFDPISTLGLGGVNFGSTSGDGRVIAGFELSPVPEPSTLMLFSLGIVVLIGAPRIRKK